MPGPHITAALQAADTVALELDLTAAAVLADLGRAIAALLGRGRRVFAAAGALHMTGPMVLPRLMAQRGWRVDRITWPAP